jgi:hypothetical protein
MRRVLPALLLLAACGGSPIPLHNGYKSEKAQPWKKPKTLTLDAKSEAKADGSLSYPDMRRAKWFALDLPSNGELAIHLEVAGPGDNEEFDMGMEIYDGANHVIAKADLDDDDAHEIQKTRTLKDLTPGHYLIHLWVNGRLDVADYNLKLGFKSTSAPEVKSDFPAQVAFLPTLPLVPVTDDTPANRIVKVVTPVKPTGKPGHHPHVAPVETPAKPADKPKSSSLTARIVGLNVVAGGTQITINVGTNAGAAEGMKLVLAGNSTVFSLSSCKASTCSALLAGVTPDMVNRAHGAVTLSP